MAARRSRATRSYAVISPPHAISVVLRRHQNKHSHIDKTRGSLAHSVMRSHIRRRMKNPRRDGNSTGAIGSHLRGHPMQDALDALSAVKTELDRLAALARARDPYRAALTIARELKRHGVTGSRRAIWACPLARHLSRVSGARVGVTRHEVAIADSSGEIAHTIQLTEPSDALLPVREFVVQYDDYRRRFRWLDEKHA